MGKVNNLMRKKMASGLNEVSNGKINEQIYKKKNKRTFFLTEIYFKKKKRVVLYQAWQVLRVNDWRLEGRSKQN